MNQVHVPALAWEELKSPSGKFHSFVQNISLALGGQRNLGPWGGGHPFDVQVRRIPAGAAVCPFHSHFAQWEMFVVLSGEATVRAGDATHRVKAGGVFLHPPREPHQLTNTGSAELEVLIVADNPLLDACYYPDSNKWAFRTEVAPVLFFRLNEADYFAGEDPSATGKVAGNLASLCATPAQTLFRQLHPDELPWETWHSPKGKFRGASKEISIALGAKRNMPPQLGGHPFDLELNKLAPGERGCPFHSHAAQWEMFLIVAGRGTIRAGNESHDMATGDVVLHPPGEAHDIANTGETDLIYWLIADNPPVDYWQYPESQKWGLREPRKFFRPTEVDYWDGEE